MSKVPGFLLLFTSMAISEAMARNAVDEGGRRRLARRARQASARPRVGGSRLASRIQAHQRRRRSAKIEDSRGIRRHSHRCRHPVRRLPVARWPISRPGRRTMGARRLARARSAGGYVEAPRNMSGRDRALLDITISAFGMVVVGLSTLGHAGQMTLEEINGGSRLQAHDDPGRDGSRFRARTELRGEAAIWAQVAETRSEKARTGTFARADALTVRSIAHAHADHPPGAGARRECGDSTAALAFEPGRPKGPPRRTGSRDVESRGSELRARRS